MADGCVAEQSGRKINAGSYAFSRVMSRLSQGRGETSFSTFSIKFINPSNLLGTIVIQFFVQSVYKHVTLSSSILGLPISRIGSRDFARI